MYKILAINPGATSTKIGVYIDENPLFIEIIRHEGNELAKFSKAFDQYHYRENVILDALKKRNIDLNELSAVVGRGGTFKPLQGGVYEVNKKMIEDVKNGNVQADHVSLIGCILAKEIADSVNIPAYIVDPVSVDEFIDEARISGLPELPRKSLSHALNMKMVARKEAGKMGKNYEEVNFIIAHLGGGISISPHRKGKIIDANNANDGGPMSPQRAGTLPVTGLIKLCYQDIYTEKEILTKVLKKGGLTAHCNTDDLREVIKRIDNGDKKAENIYNAMTYQIAKEIGAMAAVLKGKIDAIIITGGMAYQEKLTKNIESYISWIAPVKIYPGEDELEALTLGTLMILRGDVKTEIYK